MYQTCVSFNSHCVIITILLYLVVLMNVISNHYACFLGPFQDAACCVARSTFKVSCVFGSSDMSKVDDSDVNVLGVSNLWDAIQKFIHASLWASTESLASKKVIPLKFLRQV